MTESTEVPRVLVLTPMKNTRAYLETYAALLEQMDWPRERLSLGILEGDSTDGTWEALQSLRARLEARCAAVSLHQRHFGFQIPPGVPRWAPGFQLARRNVLARARNQLLFRSLADEDYVLWIDADLASYPPSVLRQLVATCFDLVMPNCVQQPGGPTFDRNAWGERGHVSLDTARGQGPTRLSAVGGTMLLVKAELHRDGLVFPPFRYGVASPHIREGHPVWGQGEVETEGLGIMALDMGAQPWGMPDLEIVHVS